MHDRNTGQTRLVSVDSNGVGTNNHSDAPDISADGKFVAFNSDASNLVATDLNAEADIFVHDCGFSPPQPDVLVNGSEQVGSCAAETEAMAMTVQVAPVTLIQVR